MSLTDLFANGRTVTIEIRPRFKNPNSNQPVKPAVLSVIGKRVDVVEGWVQDASDQYPGELALLPADRDDPIFRSAGITWISSGDVAIVPRTVRDLDLLSEGWSCWICLGPQLEPSYQHLVKADSIYYLNGVATAFERIEPMLDEPFIDMPTVTL